MRRVFLTVLLSLTSLASAAAGETLRVAVPVADLRGEPASALAQREHDPLEETQLLYGDPVEVVEEKGDWVRVRAVDQLEWNHHGRWEGYPGWMEKKILSSFSGEWEPNLAVSAKWAKILALPQTDAPVLLELSLGTRVMGTAQIHPAGGGGSPWWKIQLLSGGSGWIPAGQASPLVPGPLLFEEALALRARCVETAQLFLGDPYYWGGRSAYRRDWTAPPHVGVDCSGLVSLVYQANGISIPRDAHEQWMRAAEIPEEKLSPGDLVFLFDPKDRKRVTHVMLYVGRGRVIEGPGTGDPIRESGLAHRLRESEDRRVAFGSYLP
ncbi:MAG: C40 family peptidase [Candidatus Omnitrophica bacterium]|nr:C40 family peptidase [Candidatus Omnitrophota bacterium]